MVPWATRFPSVCPTPLFPCLAVRGKSDIPSSPVPPELGVVELGTGWVYGCVWGWMGWVSPWIVTHYPFLYVCCSLYLSYHKSTSKNRLPVRYRVLVHTIEL